MEKKFMDLWTKNKHKLESYFRDTQQKEYDNYKEIVKKIIELVINDDLNDYNFDNYDFERMTVIDDGDYQGTQLYLIPNYSYQPSAEDYIFTHNYYGSCSGCDTLKVILSYDTDEKPSEEQLKDYMLLSLHIVEHLSYLIPRNEEENI